MKIDPKRIDDGLWEWKDVTPADQAAWLHCERVSHAAVHVVGDGRVEMVGTLFDDPDAAYPDVALLTLTPGQPLQSIASVPWRIRPVVKDGEKTTVRAYIPRR